MKILELLVGKEIVKFSYIGQFLNDRSASVFTVDNSCDQFPTLTVPSCPNIRPIQIEVQGVCKLLDFFLLLINLFRLYSTSAECL